MRFSHNEYDFFETKDVRQKKHFHLETEQASLRLALAHLHFRFTFYDPYRKFIVLYSLRIPFIHKTYYDIKKSHVQIRTVIAVDEYFDGKKGVLET